MASASPIMIPRRFRLHADDGAQPRWNSTRLFRDLGPEPVGNALDADYLASVFAGRRKTPDQIRPARPEKYCWTWQYLCLRGSVPLLASHQTRKAESLVSKTGKRLATALRESRSDHPCDVIAEAIEAGGSSLRDHAQPSGELGYFQHRFAVYDREGETCITPGCGSRMVQRMVQSGRSTFYCPTMSKIGRLQC